MKPGFWRNLARDAVELAAIVAVGVWLTDWLVTEGNISRMLLSWLRLW